ncbi:MAG: ATP-binding protein [Fidelibacterota bacterium]
MINKNRKTRRSEANSKAPDRVSIMDHIFNSITEMIAVTTPELDIVMANKIAKVLINNGKEIREEKCYEKLRDNSSQCDDCPITRTLNAGKVIPTEYYDIRFHEYFEERAYPVADQKGDINYFIIICRNITKRKEIEHQYSQSKKLQALGQMASGIAHDFNNILTTILGNSQFLATQLKKEEHIKILRTIEQSALDGAETVRRMQQFIRIRNSEKFLPVNVNEMIEDVISFTESRWKDEAELKGIFIKIERHFQDTDNVLGNISELRTALINIIFNSIDAMEYGGVLSFYTRDSGDQVEIEIKDTGCGMTPEVLEKVFDPFFTTKGVRGNGLGMSEVFGIIQRHGGLIDIKSKINKGTSVIISLPKSLIKKEEKRDLLRKTPKPSIIYVVDDDIRVLDFLQKVLSSQNHHIFAFSDPNKAFEELDKNKPDVVITDLGMPNMTGDKFARTLKSNHPEIPIILITGWFKGISGKEEIFSRHFDFVLQKPFKISELENMLSKALIK